MTLLMTLPGSDVISHARAHTHTHTHTPHIMFSATKYKDEQQEQQRRCC